MSRPKRNENTITKLGKYAFTEVFILKKRGNNLLIFKPIHT